MKETLYHFIGIGGIGMSGLAKILLEKGYHVQGSDLAASHVTDGLVKNGAKVFFGHAKDNVPHGATVVYTSDIAKTNPEFMQALHLQCPMMHRSDLLLALTGERELLAVTGTHGKTTTTALLAHVLVHAKRDPCFAVGGLLAGFDVNAIAGKGKEFVVEADESDGTFLKYPYKAAIVTNIDSDHLAHFGSFDVLKQAFKQFLNKAPISELLFWCADDMHLKEMCSSGISYGFSDCAALRICRFSQKQWSIVMDIAFRGVIYRDVKVALTGRHNACNSAAVFGLALQLGIAEEIIREAFQSFKGVKRRMERKDEISGILVVDDYAHHPTEVCATLAALRNAVKERRIIALFQPHRYSRLKYIINKFDGAFQDADTVIVTDLYTAQEDPVPGITTEAIVAAIKKKNECEVLYVPREALVEHVAAYVRPHDVVITLGAGDLTKVGQELCTVIEARGVTRWRVGLLYGGKSQEHQVAIASAKHFENNINPAFYDMTVIEVARDGQWNERPFVGDMSVREKTSPISTAMMQLLETIDVCIPVLHGPNGEDGKIQGLFEVLGKAYVGCDVTGCAISMNKGVAKQLALAKGIPTTPFVLCNIQDWKERREEILCAMQQLCLPLFVKPVHFGSTIGICKVEYIEELAATVDEVLKVDSEIIVEQGVVGVREIETAVLGNFDPEIAPPGEILTGGAFYSYDVKYGTKALGVAPYAALTEEQRTAVLDQAVTMYTTCRCQGLARVDFFLAPDGIFLFNEINPMPGFTVTSLYPKMWEEAGHSMSQVVDRAVVLALARKRLADRMYAYSTQHYHYDS